jgi:hypothetical protein
MRSIYPFAGEAHDGSLAAATPTTLKPNKRLVANLRPSSPN